MKVIVYGYGLMGKKIYHHLKNDNGFEILGVCLLYTSDAADEQ